MHSREPPRVCDSTCDRKSARRRAGARFPCWSGPFDDANLDTWTSHRERACGDLELHTIRPVSPGYLLVQSRGHHPGCTTGRHRVRRRAGTFLNEHLVRDQGRRREGDYLRLCVVILRHWTRRPGTVYAMVFSASQRTERRLRRTYSPEPGSWSDAGGRRFRSAKENCSVSQIAAAVLTARRARSPSAFARSSQRRTSARETTRWLAHVRHHAGLSSGV
jgi:hypothetical protein